MDTPLTQPTPLKTLPPKKHRAGTIVVIVIIVLVLVAGVLAYREFRKTTAIVPTPALTAEEQKEANIQAVKDTSEPMSDADKEQEIQNVAKTSAKSSSTMTEAEKEAAIQAVLSTSTQPQQ